MTAADSESTPLLSGAQLRALGWEGPAIGEILKMTPDWNPPWLRDHELLREIAASPQAHLDHPDLDQAIYLLMVFRQRRAARSRRRRPRAAPPRSVIIPLRGEEWFAAEVLEERWAARPRGDLWKRLITPPERNWAADWTPQRAGQPWSRAAARRLGIQLTTSGLELSTTCLWSDLNWSAGVIRASLQDLLRT